MFTECTKYKGEDCKFSLISYLWTSLSLSISSFSVNEFVWSCTYPTWYVVSTARNLMYKHAAWQMYVQSAEKWDIKTSYKCTAFYINCLRAHPPHSEWSYAFLEEKPCIKCRFLVKPPNHLNVQLKSKVTYTS